jgi:hypothetical protein
MKPFGPNAALALFLGCTLAGCASTSLTSYQDPAYTRASYWKFAVLYASYDASLIDLRTGQVAWMASARTGGSEYAGVAEIIDSFASRTADALEERQLLAIRPAGGS